MLLLAIWASPESVGIYNWGTILFTCVMSVTDGALRQVLIRVLLAKGGRKFLRRYQIAASISATLFLALGLLALWLAMPAPYRAEVILLTPIVLAPLVSVSNAKFLGVLQVTHHWSVLAKGQGVAALVSLLIAVPFLILVSPILACALGLLVTEITFAAYCWTAVRRISRPRPDSSTKFKGAEYRNMAAYSGLGWLQGQSDRLVIGAIAGPGSLGIFSIAAALARSLGDTLASSNANLLRAQLGVPEKGGSGSSRIISPVLRRSLLMAIASSFVVVVLVRLVVDPLLDSSWDQAMSLVAILSLCNVPAVLSWSAGVLHVHYGTSKRALLAPVLGVAFALPTAVLAAIDLRYVVWVVVAREVVLCLVAYGLLGARAPWRMFSLALIGMIGLSATYWLFGFF